jgi:hypothetical protein
MLNDGCFLNNVNLELASRESCVVGRKVTPESSCRHTKDIIIIYCSADAPGTSWNTPDVFTLIDRHSPTTATPAI